MHSLVKSRFKIAVFLVSASLLALPVASPSVAAIPQCGTRGPYLDGFYQFPSTSYEGVHARITAQWGYVCDTDTDPASNFTNAWSMISDNNGYKWAQSGVERGYNTGLRHFSQIVRNDFDDWTRYGSYISEGENHGYWQQYDPGGSCLLSNVDLTTLTHTCGWFDPKASGEWPQPFGVQYFGEAAYQESDIPGYVGTQTDISGLQVQRSSDHQYIATPCFLAYLNQNTLGRWANQAYSCTHFNIWTN